MPDFSGLSEPLKAQAINNWQLNNPPIPFTMSLDKFYPGAIVSFACCVIVHVIYYWIEVDV